MVVPVLITNCQVSEKPKTGPVAAQTIIVRSATTEAHGEPTVWDVLCAKMWKMS